MRSHCGAWVRLLVLLLALVAACKESSHPSGPSGPRVASVVIAPETVTVLVQNSIQFTATPRDSAGQPISGSTPTWSSSDTAVLSVTGGGLGQAKKGGTVMVSATVSGVAGSAAVSVIKPAIDSIAANGTDSTVASVGHGSSIVFPAGMLPSGTKVRVDELPGALPAVTGTQLGNPIRVQFTLATPAAARASNAIEQAIDPRTFELRIRTRVSQSVDRLSERAHLLLREGTEVGKDIVVKADRAVEAVDQFGRRTVETVLVVRVIALRDGAYDFTASVVLNESSCGPSAWSLTKFPLSSSDGPSTSPGRIPIILVHGWQLTAGTCELAEAFDPAMRWRVIMDSLKNDAALRERYEVWIYRYPSFLDLALSAQTLAARISASNIGTKPKLLVGHSMGGLVSARYTATSGVDVRSLITLGTPFGGSPLADDFSVVGSTALTYNSCIGPTLTVTGRLLIWLLLRKVGVTQLAPSSPFLTTLSAAASSFGPKLRAYGATYTWTDAVIGAEREGLFYLVGGCLLSARGFTANDGLVPLAASRTGPDGANISPLQTPLFPGTTHAGLLTDRPPVSSILSTLRQLATQIPTEFQSLQLAGGDRQTALPSTVLPQSLSVRAVDSRGVPVTGATVTFAVATGAGSVSPSTTNTDTNGYARASFQLGASTGTQTVTATSAGPPQSSVTFTAFSGSPPPDFCPIQAYTIGSTVNGSLTTSDCFFNPPPTGNDSYFDSYETVATTFQAWRLTLNMSTAPGVGVRGPFDRPFNYTHAEYAEAADRTVVLKVLVPPGSVTLRPTTRSSRTTATYTLSSVGASTDVQACELVLILPGTETSQQLRSGDCQRGSFLADEYQISMPAGARLTVEQTSSDFDAYIRLYKSGVLVDEDDDSGGGTDAMLIHTSSANVGYVISASSFSVGATGNYRIRVSIDYPPLNSVRNLRELDLTPSMQSGIGLPGSATGQTPLIFANPPKKK